MASEVYPRDAGKVFFFSYILTPGSTQAEELNLRIALENLGDGRNNSLNTGRLAGSLIQQNWELYQNPTPISRETPLRIMRAPDASPRRASPAVPLHRIRRIPDSFLAFVRNILQP